MRRPLDWIAVSICLALLPASGARLRPASEIFVTSPPPAQPGASPFAWIQEDGTELYLPATGSAGSGDLGEEESAYAELLSTTHALYTWSSPANDAEAERAWYP